MTATVSTVGMQWCQRSACSRGPVVASDCDLAVQCAHLLTAAPVSLRAGALPSWFRGIRTQLAFLSAGLRTKWSRAAEMKLRDLIHRGIPAYCTFMYRVDTSGSDLHMEMLREALLTGSAKWFARATQFGRRHASFPLMYDWDEFSTYLRKYVVYCLVHFDPLSRAPTLPLLPCPRLRYIDYVEWLPSAGIAAGWSSIRHYAGQLRYFSKVCGFGDIVDSDVAGHTVWQENFSANVRVERSPRGGDSPLRPWHLRRFVLAFPGRSPYDKMMLATCSLMWFTALRAGHFSPKSATEDGQKHLIQWAHVHPYDAVSFTVPRPAAHFIVPSSKSAQAESASTFTTATCCICEGAEGDADEQRALRLLCPVHALERWRRVAPGHSRYICCDPASGLPILRTRFNRELRAALDVALGYLPDADRAAIIKGLSAKSWRSGAGTAIVTATNAGFVAAAFLGHSDPKVTKQYYHKGDDAESFSVVGPLTSQFSGGPSQAGRLHS